MVWRGWNILPDKLTFSLGLLAIPLLTEVTILLLSTYVPSSQHQEECNKNYLLPNFHLYPPTVYFDCLPEEMSDESSLILLFVLFHVRKERAD